MGPSLPCRVDPDRASRIGRFTTRRPGERDVRVPHPRVVAEVLHREAAQPGAKEPADLVRQRRRPNSVAR